MATVLAYATTSLTEEQKSNLVSELGTAVTTGLRLPPELRTISWIELPQASTTPKDFYEITFFVYTAPGKPVEAKRDLVSNLQETTERVLSGLQVKTIVIIKEHADENVGVGGQLRLDIVAAQANQ